MIYIVIFSTWLKIPGYKALGLTRFRFLLFWWCSFSHLHFLFVFIVFYSQADEILSTLDPDMAEHSTKNVFKE